MFDLFQLPLEVRQMIYADCPVVGKVFPYNLAESYDEYECDYDDDLTARELAGYEAPEVALLRVCKTIHLEAEPLLYKYNTFVLPPSDLTTRFFKRSLHNDFRRAWIKSVVLSFDASDLTRDDREIILDERLKEVRDDMLFPEISGAWELNFKESVHETFMARLADCVWPTKARFVLDFLRCEKLVIDFRNSKCVEGCCIQRIDAIRALHHGFAHGMPEVISLRGVPAAAEPIVDLIQNWTCRRLCIMTFTKEEEQLTALSLILKDNEVRF